MKILAVEFSSERRSVAVVDNGVVLSQAVAIGGRAAIDLVDQALGESKVQREQIDCIAVGVGPGSYTGIRGAISLAQGWQLAKDIKLIGISSVECIAAQARHNKTFGNIAIAVDAQREEFYIGRYQIDLTAYKETEPLRIVPAHEARQLQEQGVIIIGPDAEAFGGRQLFPEAASLGILAATKTHFISGENLEPIYLRETAFVKVKPLK